MIVVALLLTTAWLPSAGCDIGEVVIGDDRSGPTAKPEGCPKYLDRAWGTHCDKVPRGTSCFEQDDSEWRACYCGCHEEGIWTCESMPRTEGCPALPPIEESPCVGDEFTVCSYFPDLDCRCFEDGWSCSRVFPHGECSSEHVWQGPAQTAINESKRIKDLSHAEVEAWCAWYAEVTGSSQEAETPTADGWVDSDQYRSRICQENQACALLLPRSQCESSLEIQPCEATLGELDDCVKTMDNGCFLVGHGCAPLRQKPWCQGIIVGLIETDGSTAHAAAPHLVCRVHVDNPPIDFSF